MTLNDLLNLEKNRLQKILAVCDDESEPEIEKCLKDFVNKTFRSPDDLKDLSGSFNDSIVVFLPIEQITRALLEQLVKLGAQGSSLTILNITGDTGDIKFILTTTGYTNIVVRDFNSKPSITAFKPQYQIGSSSKLNIQKTATAAAVWKLDDDLDDEAETIDPDNLLDEDDLKKPDPSSLKVCGTTGKRKACKDCSCGLAEELEVEAKAGAVVDTSNAPKSSCGSCYLGDAFRCASCPYLGMPAFKPGDKIQISDNLLKADI